MSDLTKALRKAVEFKQFLSGRKLVKGHIIQVGWLIQNQQGVWFGLALSAQDHFEDLGAE